ncbi:hypothetical protein BBJ29_007372 [Phytophthora kernoviae]|uniref:Uncharacterized protein n=1 Tax=Phytophthora kernoviae TaxID=325452 RepID=A0A3R7IXW1_9STRA|nr:hypothetical protein BBJ29_007372 [Phytophthora kernoviae]
MAPYVIRVELSPPVETELDVPVLVPEDDDVESVDDAVDFSEEDAELLLVVVVLQESAIEPTQQTESTKHTPATAATATAAAAAAAAAGDAALARRGLKNKSLDVSGAAAVSVMGLLTLSSGYRFGVLLLGFYFSGSKLTKVITLGTVTGLFGSVFDSVLGATVQVMYFDRASRKICDESAVGGDVEYVYGVDLLNNEQVNVVSVLVTFNDGDAIEYRGVADVSFYEDFLYQLMAVGTCPAKGHHTDTLLIAKQKRECAEKQAEAFRAQAQKSTSGADKVLRGCFQKTTTPRVVVDMNLQTVTFNSAFMQKFIRALVKAGGIAVPENVVAAVVTDDSGKATTVECCRDDEAEMRA